MYWPAMIFARDAVGSLLERAMSANLMPRQDQLGENLVVESHSKRYKTTNAHPDAANVRIPSSR